VGSIKPETRVSSARRNVKEVAANPWSDEEKLDIRQRLLDEVAKQTKVLYCTESMTVNVADI